MEGLRLVQLPSQFFEFDLICRLFGEILLGYSLKCKDLCVSVQIKWLVEIMLGLKDLTHCICNVLIHITINFTIEHCNCNL